MINRRLVDYHMMRLSDKSREVRLKSIQELRLLCDVAALDVLKQVYANDIDPDVRKAAQEAGREIFLKNKQVGA